MDEFATSAYLIVVFLELLILLLAAILNPIAHYRRRHAKANGTIKEVETADKITSSSVTIVHLEQDENKLADPPHEVQSCNRSGKNPTGPVRPVTGRSKSLSKPVKTGENRPVHLYPPV